MQNCAFHLQKIFLLWKGARVNGTRLGDYWSGHLYTAESSRDQQGQNESRDPFCPNSLRIIYRQVKLISPRRASHLAKVTG